MEKLYKEVETPKPTLNSQSGILDCDLSCLRELERRWRSRKKQIRLRRKNASTSKPNSAAVLKTIPGWAGDATAQRFFCWGQVCPDFPSPTKNEGGESWLCGINSGQRQRAPILPDTNWLSCKIPTPGRPHPGDIPMRGNWGGAINPPKTPQSSPQTRGWGLAAEHCSWCKRMQQMQSVARDCVKLAPARAGTWVFPPGPNAY